jgi:hypothetical protein
MARGGGTDAAEYEGDGKTGYQRLGKNRDLGLSETARP